MSGEQLGESEVLYILLNTLENNDIEEWVWHLGEEIINNWDELKTKFLSMQKPVVEYQM